MCPCFILVIVIIVHFHTLLKCYIYGPNSYTLALLKPTCSMYVLLWCKYALLSFGSSNYATLHVHISIVWLLQSKSKIICLYIIRDCVTASLSYYLTLNQKSSQRAHFLSCKSVTVIFRLVFIKTKMALTGGFFFVVEK